MVTGLLALGARSRLYRELASLLRAGLGPRGALEALARQPPRGIPPEALVRTLQRVQAGEGLGASLDLGPAGPPPAERACLEAAEATGRLDRALEELALGLEARSERRRRLATALAYPGFLLHMVVVVASIPALTRGTGACAGRVLLLAAALWGGVAALVLAGRWVVLRSPHPHRLPGVGRLLATSAQASYLTHLSLLYGGGVPLARASALAAATIGNAALRDRLQAVAPALEAGEPLVAALGRSGLVDGEVLGLLARAEQAGDLEGAAARAGLLLAQREERSVQRLSKAAGWLVYAVAAAAVAWTVLAFYSAYYAAVVGTR